MIEKSDVDAKADDFYAAMHAGNQHFPPLFGEGFAKGNLNWKPLTEVQFDQVGKLLTCHLVIEHYLNKLLELRLPKHIDMDAANLNFAQKLKMLREDNALASSGFYQGITIINKMRNKFSHHLEAKVDASEIGILVSILEKRTGVNITASTTDTNYVSIIEHFTNELCCYLGGYCSGLIESTR